MSPKTLLKKLIIASENTAKNPVLDGIKIRVIDQYKHAVLTSYLRGSAGISGSDLKVVV